MYLTKHISFFSAFLFGIATFAPAQGSNIPVTAQSNGIMLSVAINGDKAEVTVSAPTTGWVAVGFDPVNKMKGAGFLIGYVKNGTVFVRDDYGSGTFSHGDDTKLNGTSDILSYSGTEKDGMTTVTFVVPVDSGDTKDTKLTPGTHSVILGMSKSDSFTGMHSRVGKTTITLP